MNGVTTLLDVAEDMAPTSFDMDEWLVLVFINSRNAFSAQPDTHFGLAHKPTTAYDQPYGARRRGHSEEAGTPKIKKNANTSPSDLPNSPLSKCSKLIKVCLCDEGSATLAGAR